MKKEDFEELLSKIDAKEQEMQSNHWAKEPEEYVLILSEVDDPKDFSDYQIYEKNTGWIIGWEDADEQIEAVRRLLEHNVPVVKDQWGYTSETV